MNESLELKVSFDRDKFIEKVLEEYSLEKLDQDLSDEELNVMLDNVLSKHIREIVKVNGEPINIH